MHQEQRQVRSGFTLMELLVVLVIASILAAILLPVLTAVRQKGQQATCLSNQRQVGQALLLYAQDHDDTLPSFGDRFPSPRTHWNGVILPYLRDCRTLECPSWPRAGKYRNLKGQLVGGRYGIGVAYGQLFRYAIFWGVAEPPVRLANLNDPSRVLMLVDTQGSLHAYSPLVWPMSVDWDGDGIGDSAAPILVNEGPYNRADPFRHSGGANCTFTDGHARWLAGRDWLTDQGNIWDVEQHQE